LNYLSSRKKQNKKKKKREAVSQGQCCEVLTAILDDKCEDGGFAVPGSSVTIPNPDLLSSGELALI
jgi:hypothetical protein